MRPEHDQLLHDAIDGKPEALSALVRAYHDRVHRFGVRVCRDRVLAEDAVQEAFLKLAGRPDVQRDPSALSWLMTVVRNACARMLRPFSRERTRLGERVDPETVASAELSPEAVLRRWQLIHLVHEAIAQLEKPYREVIILRDIEGLSGDEVCAALELSGAAMKSRLHRARTMLRDGLMQHEIARAEGLVS
jgi:RNA polymerase sigma-70 factor (ECF subfamily)